MDFKEINSGLVSRSDSVLSEWFPLGKIRGSEFVVGNIQGDPGDSLSINVSTGRWADFAADISGGDLISLYAKMHSLSQGDAAKKLNPDWKPHKNKPTVRRPKQKFVKPPKNSKPEIKGHPIETYCYRDTDGEPLFYITKYIINEKKVFTTYSYNGTEWQKKAWPSNRPIYGLELLNSKPILIVEGEKCANALRVVCRQYTVISWPGGGNAVDKTDWDVLAGRDILIWPDADTAGKTAAEKIAFNLYGKTKSLKILNITDRPKGWDCADAVEDGWTWDYMIEWAKPIAVAYKPPAKPAELIVPDDDEEGTASLYDGHSCEALWESLGLSRMKNGSVHCNTDNVVRIISQVKEFKNKIWYDDFHNKYFFNKNGTVSEWADHNDLELMIVIQNRLGLTKITKTHVNDAIQYIGRQKIKNEPKDWMECLEWDEIPRLDSMLTECFGAKDDEYTTAASKNWFISMVARIYNPGCKVDNMIILESKQGSMKSTALDIIGSPWYTEINESVTSKDFYLGIQGRMVVEISELDSFSKAESNTIKKVITTRDDRFRPPYGRATASFPRTCVFTGSTNETHYMQDPTGGRRFWPVGVGEINIEKLRTIRDQLFAEAIYRFKQGEPWWLMPESAKDEQENRREQDVWEDMISDWLIKYQKTDIRSDEVATQCLKIEISKIDRRVQCRICNVLKVLGWETKTVRANGSKPQRKWVKDLTFDLD